MTTHEMQIGLILNQGQFAFENLISCLPEDLDSVGAARSYELLLCKIYTWLMKPGLFISNQLIIGYKADSSQEESYFLSNAALKNQVS